MNNMQEIIEAAWKDRLLLKDSKTINCINEVIEAIDKGELPVLRGYKLTRQDKICRDVINTIRTYFQISYQDIEKKYEINFHEYFKKSLKSLDEFALDGLVIKEEGRIRLTPNGEHFSTLIASAFDPHRKIPLYNPDIRV